MIKALHIRFGFFCFSVQFVCCFILLQSWCSCVAAQDNKELLRELDCVVRDRDYYEQQVCKQIGQLEKLLDYASGKPKVQFDVLGDLFQIYRSYRVDKAYEVAEQRIRIAQQLDSASLKAAWMNRADALYKLGYYYDCIEQLDLVRPDSQIVSDGYYYYLYHTTYFSLYNGEYNEDIQEKYRREMIKINDQAVRYSPSGSYHYVSNYSKQLYYQGNIGEAIRVLRTYYNQATDSLGENKASVEYTLADLYLQAGDTLNGENFLIRASIQDLSDAKKVYMSLQRLAMLLYRKGDVERAYTYISCALDDIYSGKARYRFADVARYLPIISTANDLRVEQNEHRLILFISVLAFLICLLVGAFVLLRRRTVRLAAARRLLESQNRQLLEDAERLKEMNKEIKEKDRIKEEYIGLLFNVCSENVKREEMLLKRLNRIAASGHVADLSKLLAEQTAPADSFKTFIRQFDTIFLNIFPDFVMSLNALLKPEEQIVLKEGELLTPELRICALIRIGIHDNNKIASFLHYSLQTVYNYRMRMRNKALADKRDLDVWLMQI